MIESSVSRISFVAIRFGDTLQTIALRELGDAALWHDLIILNDLVFPYIVEAGSGGDRLLEYGGTIAIPSARSSIQTGDNAANLYGIDIHLHYGELRAENGDLSLVSGIANLNQAISHRVKVEKRDLWFHPEYGCWVRSLLGGRAGPVTAKLAEMYVRSSLLEDPRIKRIESSSAVVTGDQVAIEATVIPISGEAFNVSLVV